MARTIIETRGLTKRYGSVTAVDKLDLRVEEGEVFGLLGPNGAGKTTTTLMLLGLTEPTAGSAAIEGVDCTRDPHPRQARGGLPARQHGLLPGHDRAREFAHDRQNERPARGSAGNAHRRTPCGAWA